MPRSALPSTGNVEPSRPVEGHRSACNEARFDGGAAGAEIGRVDCNGCSRRETRFSSSSTRSLSRTRTSGEISMVHFLAANRTTILRRRGGGFDRDSLDRANLFVRPGGKQLQEDRENEKRKDRQCDGDQQTFFRDQCHLVGC